jgi:hypothetical protein
MTANRKAHTHNRTFAIGGILNSENIPIAIGIVVTVSSVF